MCKAYVGNPVQCVQQHYGPKFCYVYALDWFGNKDNGAFIHFLATALRMRLGQIFENHSKSFEDIPSGPPQLFLFSLDIEFLSSAKLIGEFSFCLSLSDSSLLMFSNSCF